MEEELSLVPNTFLEEASSYDLARLKQKLKPLLKDDSELTSQFVSEKIQQRCETLRKVNNPKDTLFEQLACLLSAQVILREHENQIQSIRKIQSHRWKQQAEENQREASEMANSQGQRKLKAISAEKFHSTPSGVVSGAPVKARMTRNKTQKIMQDGSLAFPVLSKKSPLQEALANGTACPVCKKDMSLKAVYRVEVGKQKLRLCLECFKKANAEAAERLNENEIGETGIYSVKISVLGAESVGFSGALKAKQRGGTQVAEDLTRGLGTEADPITLSSEDEEEQQRLENIKLSAARNRRKTRSLGAQVDPIVDKLKCTMPPEGGKGAVRLSVRDYYRLSPEEFMNDSAIDYYLRYLQWRLEREKPEQMKRCYFYNSFFYKKLSEKNGNAVISQETRSLVNSWESLSVTEMESLLRFDAVRKWTGTVDIFEKDFLFIPIHADLHWSLVVVCHPGAPINLIETDRNRISRNPQAFILHLDSMGGGHKSATVTRVVKQYLNNEWLAKLKDPTFPKSVPKLWTERNAEHFLADIPAALNTQLVDNLSKRESLRKYAVRVPITSDPNFFTRQWFSPKKAGLLRSHMAKMVLIAMAKENGLMDENGKWTLDGLSNDARHQAEFIMEQLDTIKDGEKYDAPSWARKMDADIEIVNTVDDQGDALNVEDETQAKHPRSKPAAKTNMENTQQNYGTDLPKESDPIVDPSQPSHDVSQVQNENNIEVVDTNQSELQIVLQSHDESLGVNGDKRLSFLTIKEDMQTNDITSGRHQSSIDDIIENGMVEKGEKKMSGISQFCRRKATRSLLRKRTDLVSDRNDLLPKLHHTHENQQLQSCLSHMKKSKDSQKLSLSPYTLHGQMVQAVTKRMKIQQGKKSCSPAPVSDLTGTKGGDP